MHHQMKSIETAEVSIVREGEIDLVAIDVNEDGMGIPGSYVLECNF